MSWGVTRDKAKGRVISNSIELSFETYRQISQKGKNATKLNIVLKKAEVLRPTKTDTVSEIENRLNDWEGEAEVSGRSRRGATQK